MRTRLKRGLALVPGLLLAAACSASTDNPPDCEGDACDTGGAVALPLCAKPGDFKTADGTLQCTPCGDVFQDQSGRGFLRAFIGQDALAEKVYMTFEDKNKNQTIDKNEIDCPLDMVAILAKLDKTDAKNCLTTESYVVSETAPKLGRNKADYRAVTARGCDGRDKFRLLFSTFGFSGRPEAKKAGVHITQDGAPGEVEIIAFDKTDGVFNFYKEVDGAMRFFGSSLDFVVGGPGGPGLTSTRGCANCHPGGGLNMKERRNPWTHWAREDSLDGTVAIPGAQDLVNSRPYLGELQPGSDLEFLVTEPGNIAWNQTRARFLATATTASLAATRDELADDEMSADDRADIARRQLKKQLSATQMLLEPLFCSVQVNIAASGSLGVPSDLFFNTIASGLGGGFPFARLDVGTGTDDFKAAIAAIGSNVPGLPGVAELDDEFMTIERSHEDETYIRELVAIGVIDQQFAEDVEMVDFTRPVFSDDRCALLALVPDLPPAERKPAKIRDAVLDAVKASGPKAGTAAAQLVVHLEANRSGKPIDHNAVLDRYAAACMSQPPKELLRDSLKLRSLQRQLAFGADGKLDDADNVGLHPYLVFEFEQTMPADEVTVTPSAAAGSVDKVAPGARFEPNECKLVNEFVAPADAPPAN